ncbi:MAG: hypothetical protein ABFD82_01700 [Syntrophaceae bacterium]
MSLLVEKNRIIGEINAYLKGKHDPDKIRIATVCRTTVQLAITFRELLSALRAFREELLLLVGKKNIKRWIAHSAGQLDKILEKGIERCTTPAANELGLAKGMKKAPDTTVKDWNRNKGGKAYLVNNRAFTKTDATIDDIRTFLREAGIASERIRDFLCDYSNQDALLGMGHAFGVVANAAIKMFPVYSGAFHTIKTKTSRSVVCRDQTEFNMLVSNLGRQTQLNPPLHFITSYELVDDGRNVQMNDVEYSLESLTAVPKELHTKLQASLTKINTVT